MDGGVDGVLHEGSVAKVNGNRNVPYLNRNDSKRNLNLNWFDNDWNANYRFLAVRHFHDFSRPNRREFCFAVACAIHQASGRSPKGFPRDGCASLSREPSFPRRVEGGVSTSRLGQYSDQRAQLSPYARCSWRESSTQSRGEIRRLFSNQG